MREGEGKGAGLDMNLPSSHEHRLESNTLLPNIPLISGLGAIANRTNSSKVLIVESIFIAFKNYSVRVHSKGNIWRRSGFTVIIVVGILE
jgi:hypothetical protein